MRKIPAIAVRHGRKNVFPVARSLQHDLCDPWKIFADRIGVVGVSCAESVKINLLIKIQVGVRPLPFSRETRVVNSAFQAALPPAVGYCTCAMVSGSALPVAVS